MKKIILLLYATGQILIARLIIMENEVQKALDLIVDEKYTDALELLIPLANTGNTEAQANVGFLYQNGLGVDRDIKKAIKWLTEAADHGSGTAAHNLGTLYVTCEPDEPVDAEKSKYWYRKAKEMGFVVSTDPDWFENDNANETGNE